MTVIYYYTNSNILICGCSIFQEWSDNSWIVPIIHMDCRIFAATETHKHRYDCYG